MCGESVFKVKRKRKPPSLTWAGLTTGVTYKELDSAMLLVKTPFNMLKNSEGHQRIFHNELFIFKYPCFLNVYKKIRAIENPHDF